MPDSNPYTAPKSDPAGLGAATKTIGSPRAIIWAWEKLRVRYNLILAIPGIIILFFYVYRAEMPLGVACMGGLMMALGANICYFLGPISEVYAAALFNLTEIPTYRKIAFWLGVIGSLGMFAFAALPSIL